MSSLAHATIITFLDPDPDGPIHEYLSIRCAPTPPKALISNSTGKILIDSHVISVKHNPAASVYTIE